MSIKLKNTLCRYELKLSILKFEWKKILKKFFYEKKKFKKYELEPKIKSRSILSLWTRIGWINQTYVHM